MLTLPIIIFIFFLSFKMPYSLGSHKSAIKKFNLSEKVIVTKILSLLYPTSVILHYLALQTSVLNIFDNSTLIFIAISLILPIPSIWFCKRTSTKLELEGIDIARRMSESFSNIAWLGIGTICFTGFMSIYSLLVGIHV
ncbi:hypothetical protein [Pleionea sediminis]|uniref:hypothetical protein n=1 Tax=Pleionea sediminis TaxID=2569479 RepID=UPI001184F7AC|nr:hypothetical protein [Pleionea sediminis]